MYSHFKMFCFCCCLKFKLVKCCDSENPFNKTYISKTGYKILKPEF